MFDPGRDQPTISFPVSDRIGHRTHTNNNNNNNTWGSNKKPPKSYNNYHHHSWNDVGVLQLGTTEESGICSPPLWNTSPTSMSPHHRRNHYRCLSPESKTQAIARGQKELMEMVRNMPESSYELSLKDLVEKQPRVEERNNSSNKIAQKREGVVASSGRTRKVDVNNGKVKRSSGNIDSGGFYLKMGFPISLGSKKKNNKKKNESSVNNNSSKVSPRTSSVSDKGLDKEWWKKKSFSASGGGESDSGVSSINSGSMKSTGSSSSTSSSRSNSRHEMSASSCWPFLRRPESLSQK